MPFFSYRGTMFCYLWVQKKDLMPYVGFVEGLCMGVFYEFKHGGYSDFLIASRKSSISPQR